MGDAPSPLSWSIDVCCYCGAHAIWPGCEHWQAHPGWCVPVRVRTTPGAERRLRQAIVNAVRERDGER